MTDDELKPDDNDDVNGSDDAADAGGTLDKTVGVDGVDHEQEPEGFDEFFERRAQWTGGESDRIDASDVHGDPDSGDLGEPDGPDVPSDDNLPFSRRQRRRDHKTHQRHNIILIVAACLVLTLIGVGVFEGYRALSRWSAARASQESSSESLDYPGPGTGTVTFTIATGESVNSVASRLVSASVVKSADAFTTVVSANDATIYPGTYQLKKHMSAADALSVVSDQSNAKGVLEIKSGERVSDVVAKAVALTKITTKEFNALIDSGGSGILPPEAGGKFEGWLEPGSYDVSTATTAAEVLKPMVKARIEKLDDLGVPTGAQREKILIMSSIAEAEVNKDDYYGKVVRVILNRLSKSMVLGMDTTVAYGAGVKASQLTDAMLADSSNTYNTRLHKGLPPSPISNPGDSAITAALNPPSGNWLYFVTTNLSTGETKFVVTEAEFWKIREEYKNSNSDAN